MCCIESVKGFLNDIGLLLNAYAIVVVLFAIVCLIISLKNGNCKIWKEYGFKSMLKFSFYNKGLKDLILSFDDEDVNLLKIYKVSEVCDIKLNKHVYRTFVPESSFLKQEKILKFLEHGLKEDNFSNGRKTGTLTYDIYELTKKGKKILSVIK